MSHLHANTKMKAPLSLCLDFVDFVWILTLALLMKTTPWNFKVWRLSLIFFFLLPFYSEKPVEERQPTLSASDLLKAHEKQVKGGKNSQSQSTSLNPVQNSRQATPMLGRGLDPGSDIFFDESPNIKKRKSSNADRAKVRWIRDRMPLLVWSLLLFKGNWRII